MAGNVTDNWLALAEYDLATIESRYTEDIRELVALLTAGEAEQVLARTKELFTWIRSRL